MKSDDFDFTIRCFFVFIYGALPAETTLELVAGYEPVTKL